LVYFHIECKNEEEAKKIKFVDFQPDKTDVNDYTLPYCTKGAEVDTDIGFEYILIQSMPCSLLKLFMFVTGAASMYDEKQNHPSHKQRHNVTFYDARKSSPGSFHETGFTLVELDEEPETTDWRTAITYDENADVAKFHKQIEPHIRKLYPDAKRMMWTYNVVRGGGTFGDQPKAVDGPHLDYHQNYTARVEFHKEFPALDIETYNMTEPQILMGKSDGENDTLGVFLGVWKPITPKVCDNPLAIMDASTFYPEYHSLNRLHINFGVLTFHNLNGAIAFDPRQKWYYYPFQTTKEVLIFHQYSNGKFFANPHTSFNNVNCPENTESRMSVEMRLALFF